MTMSDEQAKAIQSTHRETVVMAGAGAGKTRTLVGRVQWMLENGYDPRSIVVITFTRKAASEVAARLGDDRVRVGTFHSICLDLINERRKTFVLTEEMADGVVEQNNKTLKKSVSRRMIDAYRYAVALGKPGASGHVKQAAELYMGRLRHENAVDYMEMLVEGIDVAKTLGSHNVLVDEAQDTDDLQWLFVDQLKKDGLGFYVGDTRQCLYSWRNVRDEALGEREGHRFYLTGTYRFGQDLCDFSDKIAEESGYSGPGMHADGGQTTTVTYSDLDCSMLIAQAVDAYIDPNSIAVLCRYNEARENMIAMLEERGLPVAKEIQLEHSALYAALSFLANPTWTISHSSLLLNKKAGKILPEFAKEGVSPSGLTALVDVWLSSLSDNPTVAQVLDKLPELDWLEETRLWWRKRYGELPLADALRAFVVDDNSSEVTSGIRVMTIHASKGLEFDHVFVDFPSVRRFNSAEWKTAYVAVTRAKKELVITGANNPVIDLAMQLSEAM